MTAIQATARGSGLFKVYADDVLFSEHTAEREAIENATEVLAGNPSARVHYTHEYVVDVVLAVEPAPVPVPPPPPPPPPPATVEPIIAVNFDGLADTAALMARLSQAPFDLSQQKSASRMSLARLPDGRGVMAYRFNHTTDLGTDEITVGNEITLPAGLQEVWIETEYGWSPNFGTRGDHKTDFLTNRTDSYRWGFHVGYDSDPWTLGWDWPLGEGFPPQNLRLSGLAAKQLFDFPNTHLIQRNYRHSTDPATADGHYRLWIDGVLYFERLGIRTWSAGGGSERFRSFSWNRTKNGGPQQDHYFYTRGVRIWTQSPGW